MPHQAQSAATTHSSCNHSSPRPILSRAAEIRIGTEKKWMWLISTAYRNSRRGSSPRALTPLPSSELVLARAPPLGLDLATRSVDKTEGRKMRDAVGPNRL
jgi:hypothetical protein